MVITPLELLYVLLYTPRILGAISRNVQNRFLLPRIHHIGCWGGTEFMVRHLFSKRWCDPVNWLKFFFFLFSLLFFFFVIPLYQYRRTSIGNLWNFNFFSENLYAVLWWTWCLMIAGRMHLCLITFCPKAVVCRRIVSWACLYIFTWILGDNAVVCFAVVYLSCWSFLK